MSLSRAELEAMDRDELIETVTSLADTVADQQLSIDVLVDRVNELEDRADALDAAIDDNTADEIDALHRERVKLARRLTAVEEELGLDTTDVSRVADGRRTSPLYLLEHVGPEAVSDHAGPTLHRARVLVDSARRWGEERTNRKYGHHRFLASATHDVKTRLEDARGEDLQWRQVYVAMEKVADLGGDHVNYDEEYGDSQTYGKAIVWQEVAEG